jgi:hypothetical protein
MQMPAMAHTGAPALRSVLSLAAIVAMFPVSNALSQNAIPQHPMLSDRWFISAGALWGESNVSASLSTGRVGIGAIVDFEDDVGLDEENLVGVIMFRTHFLERWQVEVEYFKLDRANEKQISRTIDWGDLNVPIDAHVRGSFDVEDARVSIGYSFFKTADKEVGVGLGAHVTRMEASLSTERLGSDRAAQTAPLPFVTMYARMALSDRWLLNVRVDRLSLDTGDIDGKIFSSGAEFIYQPWRHFSIGIGYRDINFQVSSTNEDWRGKAQVQQNGPMLFVSSTF